MAHALDELFSDRQLKRDTAVLADWGRDWTRSFAADPSAVVRNDLLPYIIENYWESYQWMRGDGPEVARQIRAVRTRYPMMLGEIDEEGALVPGTGMSPYADRFYRFELLMATVTIIVTIIGF